MWVIQNIDEIGKIIEMLEKSRFDDCELELGDFKIKLGTNKSSEVQYIQAAQPYAAPAAPAVQADVPAQEASAIQGKTINAPLVGIFYSAPAPDAAPFVSVGSNVKKGDCVCIIEAMKIMNDIECELDGEIAECLVKNGDPVEFGQPLFRVK